MSSVVSRSHKIILLHYLRGVAAIMVLYLHFFSGNANETRDTTIDANLFMPIIPDDLRQQLLRYRLPLDYNFGSFGISIFFLITGFVIPLAMEKYDAKSFLINRLFRIYPCYIIGFLISFGLLLLSGFLIHGTPANFSADRVIAELFVAQDVFDVPSINKVVWTLMIELRFYLFMALVIAICPGLITLKKTVVLAAFYFVVIRLFQGFDPYLVANYPYARLVYSHIATDAHYDLYILGGTVLFLFYRQQINYVTMCVMSLVIYLEFTYLNKLFSSPSLSAENPSLWAAFLVFALCVFAIPYFRWKCRTLDFLGNISYPLYATHFLVGNVMMSYLTHTTHNLYISVLIAMSVCFSVAAVINVYVEEPANALGKHLARRH